MPRITALNLRSRHTGDLTLEFKRDDPVFHTAQVDAGDVPPCTVGDANLFVVRSGLLGELLGVLLRFCVGQVVEEKGERFSAVHSVALVFVSSSKFISMTTSSDMVILPRCGPIAALAGVNLPAGALRLDILASSPLLIFHAHYLAQDLDL